MRTEWFAQLRGFITSIRRVKARLGGANIGGATVGGANLRRNLFKRHLGICLVLLLVNSAAANEPLQSLQNVADNTWVQIEQGSVTANPNIMSYSGGWYDPVFHQFCIFGGGHWDYSGNEVWCFDINNQAWSEMYSPDVVVSQGGDYGPYNNFDNVNYPGALFNPAGEPISSANPVSKHTYDQMEYVDGLGVLVWGGYSWGDGGQGWCDECNDTWAYRHNTADWQYLFDGNNPSPNTAAGVGSSAYSTADDLLYVQARYATWTYDVASNEWRELSTSGEVPGFLHATLEYDPHRNVFYLFGGEQYVNGDYQPSYDLYEFNPDTRVWTRLNPQGTGPAGNARYAVGPGLAYDSHNRVLLVYHSGNIWVYRPDSNVWEQPAIPTLAPTDTDQIYGRFRYDPINNGVWYFDYTKTTWFYRYQASSASPAPVVSLQMNPPSGSSGDQVTLSWSASNADVCLASGDWSGTLANSGSQLLDLTSVNSSFRLTCTGAGGSDSQTVQISDNGMSSSGASVVGNGEVRYIVNNPANTTLTNIPVTVGQVFSPAAIRPETELRFRRADSEVPVQRDVKTRYADGSVQHAILSFSLADLAANSSETLVLETAETANTSPDVSLADIAAGFDTVVALDISTQGSFSASLADALSDSSLVSNWLSGPIVSEWIVRAPLRDALDQAHADLWVQFELRAFAGEEKLRVSVTLENVDERGATPTTYQYDMTVTVGGNVVVAQNAVSHAPQTRWRRVYWWTPNNESTSDTVSVEHNADYLMQTGAVPTYDDSVLVSSQGLDQVLAEFQSDDGLFGIGGGLDPYMPAPGGRMEIAPLPRFSTMYLLTQDQRAKRATLGYGEQSGSWPIHYRASDGQLISLDEAAYSNLVLDEDQDFGTGYTPDVSHHPSLAYLPYLITGDYFYLEELQFWANFSLFFKDSHAGALGLLAYKQIRGQAWGLRTLGHAAYATPDAHPLKAYFNAKLSNNLAFYNTARLNSNGLGYVERQPGPGEDPINQISAWQDDFLTWTFAHLTALGFSEAQAMRDWKSLFPVGRMTNPATCWVLATANWPYVYARGSVTNEQWAYDMTDVEINNHVDIVTWADYHNNLVWGWRQTIRPENVDLRGDESALLNAQCNSTAMMTLLNRSVDTMIGYQGTSWEGYPANLQPALAAAMEAGISNADTAYSLYQNSNSYPDFSNNPQWAIVARTNRASSSQDSDGDGVIDLLDNCPDTPNADQLNFDNDNDGDVCDNDIDNDGALNGEDSDNYNPRVCSDIDMDQCDDCSLGQFDVAADGPDLNNNGICDLSDPDDDGDGVVDTEDNCPAVDNPGQTDTNQNGVGDACEINELCVVIPNRPSGALLFCL